MGGYYYDIKNTQRPSPPDLGAYVIQ
jgi:hypothetical protein